MCSTYTLKAQTTSDSIGISISSGMGTKGSTVCVDFTIEDYKQIATGQFEFFYDANVLRAISGGDLSNSCLNSESNVINSGSFAYGDSRIAVVYIDVNRDLDDGCLLFTQCFELIGDVGDCGVFSINPSSSVFYRDSEVDSYEVPVKVLSNSVIKIVANEIACREGHCNPSFAADNGSIHFWALSGTAPYSFTVNGTPGTKTLEDFEEFELTDLGPGNYEIVITDATGAQCSQSIDLFQSGDYPFEVTLDETTPRCFDSANGEITVTENGGLPSYTYLWSTGSSNDFLEDLKVGEYAVTVTDQFGCRAIDSVRLEVDSLLMDIEVREEPFCKGSKNGRVRVSASGGAGVDYNFVFREIGGNGLSKTASGNNVIFEGVTAGLFEVYAQDPLTGCSSTKEFLTFEAGPEFSVDITYDDPCNPSTVIFNPISESFTGPYIATLVDSSGATIPTANSSGGSTVATNIGPGVYSLNMVNFNLGCILDTTFTIVQGNPINVALDKVDPSCNGGNGQVSVNVTGGSMPYTYEWADDARTAQTLDGLDGGTYEVTVTDQAGCSQVESILLLAPTAPDLLVTIDQQPTCDNGQVGAATAEVVGQSGFTFTWNDGTTTLNGASQANLAIGTYQVIATDPSGCADTTSITLSNPVSDLNITIDITLPSCPGLNDALISPILQGGPFSFEWVDTTTNNVISTNQVLRTTAGGYRLFIEDANGCKFDTLVQVDRSPNVIEFVTVSTERVSCFGTCDGRATVTAIGGASGNGPYTYQIDGIDRAERVSGVVTIDSLCAGMHSVIVFDDFCPSDTFFFEILDETEVTLARDSTEFVEPSCFGLSDGSVRIFTEGLNVNATRITWRGQPISGNYLPNIPAGTYHFEATYGRGCSITDSIVLEQPEEIVASLDSLLSNNITCSNEASGRIVTKVQGGSGPYTYAWTPDVSTSEIAANLSPGAYTVTITDSNGCNDSFTHELTAAEPVFATVPQPADPACFGQQTCLSIGSYSGGTGNEYTFTINNGPRYAIDSCINLYAGQYLVSVFDSVGCAFETNVTINQPEELSVDVGPDQTINLGESSDPISGQPVGVYPIDSFIWTPMESLEFKTDDQQIVVASPSVTTVYTLTVLDQSGCRASDDITINVENKRNVYSANIFSPNGDDANENFQLVVGPGVVEVESFEIYDRWGNTMYTEKNYMPTDNNHPGWDGKFNNNPVQAGVYIYVAKVRFIDNAVLTFRGDVTLMR